jgi:hypothetical protein
MPRWFGLTVIPNSRERFPTSRGPAKELRLIGKRLWRHQSHMTASRPARDEIGAGVGRGIEAGESRLVDKIAAFPISYPG